MKVVDKICEDADPMDDNGTIAESKQPVIKKITVSEINDQRNLVVFFCLTPQVSCSKLNLFQLTEVDYDQ